MQFLTHDVFGARANEAFVIDLGESSITVILVQVVRLKQRAWRGQVRDPFRLVFKSTQNVILPQKIYTFDNPAMGKLGIFIVPVGRDRDGVVYEAIFN